MLLRCVERGQQIPRSEENSYLSQISLGQRKVHKSESYPSGPSKRSGTSHGDVHDRGPIPLSLDAPRDPRHESRQAREVRKIYDGRWRNSAILISDQLPSSPGHDSGEITEGKRMVPPPAGRCAQFGQTNRRWKRRPRVRMWKAGQEMGHWMTATNDVRGPHTMNM
jgi:hypothetical protein